MNSLPLFLFLWDLASGSLAARLAVFSPFPGGWLAGGGLLALSSALWGLYRRPQPRLRLPCGRLLLASLTGGAAAAGMALGTGWPQPLWRGGIFALASGWLALAGRLIPPALARRRTLLLRRQSGPGSRRAAIFGAGELGQHLAEKLSLSPGDGVVPVIFLDDCPALRGKRRAGLAVSGPPEELPHLASWMALDEVIVAIHSLSPSRLSQVAALCRENGLALRRFGIAGGPADLGLARFDQIQPEQLLGREPSPVDFSSAARLLQGAVVLVTGGAGSIGSELCRQALRFGARQVIAVDIWENGLFALGEQLGEEFSPGRYRLEVGSVREENRLLRLMTRYRPSVVFHAAAHKHVPLMEENPFEAVKNNLLGTIAAASAARRAGVERFLLISTDKAVNPANVMGATKRLAEMALQLMARQGGPTIFAAVRFGNVLGSHGSVVPLFQRQIACGGPVTVTDPAMTRYFMTIPEAVQLVLEASSLARGGEIFLLDMGEPVSILSLAKEMIRLSGLRPGEDIPIVFTGLRPGEKLHEELVLAEEVPLPTKNPRISMIRPLPLEEGPFFQGVARLREAAAAEDRLLLRQELAALFPSLSPPGSP